MLQRGGGGEAGSGRQAAGTCLHRRHALLKLQTDGRFLLLCALHVRFHRRHGISQLLQLRLALGNVRL
jgi:hypothetical protein